MPGHQAALRPQRSWPTTRTRCGLLCSRLLFLLAVTTFAYPFEVLNIDDTWEEEVYSQNLDAIGAGSDDAAVRLIDGRPAGLPLREIPAPSTQVTLEPSRGGHSYPRDSSRLLLPRQTRGQVARADAPTIDPLRRSS